VTTQTIEIKNIGTIQELVFDLPDDTGGVLVLKGRNKIGKSTAIRVLRALLSGNGRGLPVRDKAVRGSAEAFGKRASVTSSVRLTGDLNVESLEGRFDFSDLVHPEAKDPETRDKIRIKALLSLTGAEADPSIFYDLVGGKEQFEKLIPADSIKKKDLIELAGMVHRAIHAEAKKKESEAEFSRGHAQACKEAAGPDAKLGSIELTPLHDASTRASAEYAAVREKMTGADETRQRIVSTKQAIEQARESYTGDSVEAAKFTLQEAKQKVGTITEELLELRGQVAKAERALEAANADSRLADDRLEAAQNHYHAVRSMETMLSEAEQSLAGEPTSIALAQAAKAAEDAREALESGIKLRDASMKLVEAESHQKTADEATKAAEKLRQAARSVDQVLSQKLPVGPLRAEAGRLVLDTERGEGAPYDECSVGEAWTYALPYGIKAVGKGGVIAVMQEAWDGLDSENRTRIAKAAKDGFCWLITAEVDDGDLRAEVFAAGE
jgi:hypothetical protein